MNGKENYIAELKVARAFYYYLLLEAFGNVPIIDRFDVPDGYLPATEPRSKVFEFVGFSYGVRQIRVRVVQCQATGSAPPRPEGAACARKER